MLRRPATREEDEEDAQEEEDEDEAEVTSAELREENESRSLKNFPLFDLAETKSAELE